MVSVGAIISGKIKTPKNEPLLMIGQGKRCVRGEWSGR